MDENDTPSTKEPGLDLTEIRQIVDLMAQNDLSYFHLMHGTFKVELRRGTDVEAAKDLLSKMPVASAPQMAQPVMSVAAHAPVAMPAQVHTAAPSVVEESCGPTINSPMVGTFYRASSPTEKAFISVGDVVDEESVVCIIEAMKVMNEIKAEACGTVARILVEDGKPVQYGQPLFE
ncbi:MAG: acetyl-CoA carboxylase biotin carboxyl carrier protein, partial [Roseimicrobium sp.]